MLRDLQGWLNGGLAACTAKTPAKATLTTTVGWDNIYNGGQNPPGTHPNRTDGTDGPAVGRVVRHRRVSSTAAQPLRCNGRGRETGPPP